MSGGIQFFTENINYLLRGKRKIREWILSTIEAEGEYCGHLNFIFCDDDFLLELNCKYLQHNTLTDILTFPFDGEGKSLNGDIYISLPRIRENAGIYEQKIENELHRVMLHGILHLIGYNDTSEQEKREMRAKEDYYLERRRLI
ncbi:MAG: rRNA maturation RNase YbeY [Bacteroidales bacterium]|nr:rRNA maturation RNase YbeY [Bacteroidales bacterium]